MAKKREAFCHRAYKSSLLRFKLYADAVGLFDCLYNVA